jgi:diacylglycerol kinase family enzyme
MIAFANSRQFGNGAQIAPRARLDDGVLEMVVVSGQPLRRIARRVPALFRGTLAEGPGLTMRSIEAASVEAPGALPFHVDGEPCLGRDRIEVEVVPRALLVRVPAPVPGV